MLKLCEQHREIVVSKRLCPVKPFDHFAALVALGMRENNEMGISVSTHQLLL